MLPIFVFLAGTSAFLSLTRGKTKLRLAGFLLARGLWLIFLEFTLVHLGWSFNFNYTFILAQVIWAIGASMVLMSLLVFAPPVVVGLTGVAIIACHNLCDGFRLEGPLAWVWTLFMRPGPIQLPFGTTLIVAYPIIPWLGILMAGYGSGAFWLMQRRRRRLILVCLGLLMILMFLALRAFDRYGDPQKWARQEDNPLWTVFSFLTVTKYPPSLIYALMTLGPALVLLALLDRPSGSLRNMIMTFGRVPLFFYLLHIPLIHTLAIFFALFTSDGDVGYLFHSILFEPNLPKDYGYRLWVVYVVWLLVVGILYPLCAWFADLKTRSRAVWLSYL